MSYSTREFQRRLTCLGRVLAASDRTLPKVNCHCRCLDRGPTAKQEQSSDDNEKHRRGRECHLKHAPPASVCFSAASAKVLKARSTRTEVVQPLIRLR